MYLEFYNSDDLTLGLESKKGKDGMMQTTLKGQPIQVATDYQPSDAVRAATQQDMKDFWFARVVQQNPYAEFNDTSLLMRLQHDQKVFNAWTPAPSDDPDLSWMSDAYRPIARNKVISVAAHITKSTIFPEIIALNQESEEDKDAASVMRDIMEWVGEQSNYAKTFFYFILDCLVLPAGIVHHEYAEATRKQKTILPNGTWTEKIVKDELFSGFQDTLLGDDELFIADAFIEDIQKQPYLIWRRAVEYDVAYAKYHGIKAFDECVKPGIQLLFDAQTVLFYRQYDENLRGKLVEEVHVWRRVQDIHRIYVNGVLVTDPEQPNERIDKLYPFVKGGYEPFNHRFFWYSSLIKKLAKDEEVVNTLYRMVIDGTYLKIFKPTFVMGEERIDGSVVVPGATIPLKADTKVVPYDVGSDLNAGLNAIAKVESSISESASSGEQNQGINPEGNTTAQEILTVEENARTLLNYFAKMVSFAVRDWGKLMVGDILQHLTVAQANSILPDGGKLKFNSFLVNNKMSGGKRKSRRIVFDDSVPEKASKMQKTEDGKPLDFEGMKAEGYRFNNGKLEQGDKEIVWVDPSAFRKLKFMTIMRAEALTPLSDVVERSLNIELFDRLIKAGGDQNEALRLLLSSYTATRDNVDKYLPKNQQPMNVSANPMNPDPNAVQGQNPQNASKVLQNIMAMKKASQNPATKSL